MLEDQESDNTWNRSLLLVRRNGEVPSNWKLRVHKRLTARRPRNTLSVDLHWKHSRHKKTTKTNRTIAVDFTYLY